MSRLSHQGFRSDLMTAIVADILPNGIPTCEDVEKMTDDERDILRHAQADIIHRFRQQSAKQIDALRAALNEIPATGGGSVAIPSQTPRAVLPPVSNRTYTIHQIGGLSASVSPRLPQIVSRQRKPIRKPLILKPMRPVFRK